MENFDPWETVSREARSQPRPLCVYFLPLVPLSQTLRPDKSTALLRHRRNTGVQFLSLPRVFGASGLRCAQVPPIRTKWRRPPLTADEQLVIAILGHSGHAAHLTRHPFPYSLPSRQPLFSTPSTSGRRCQRLRLLRLRKRHARGPSKIVHQGRRHRQARSHTALKVLLCDFAR